ncbi:MAG TPA: hypothetical protein VFS20_07705 [Longimicrobium sp.]|nr:hypothetical protein [Longimicrobium sp.]
MAFAPTAFSQLRPLGLGEILDGAFTLYRRQFASMFLTALIPQIPFILVYAVYAVLLASLGVGDPTATPEFGAASGAMLLGMLVLFPLAMLAMVIGFGAITFQVSRAYTGTPVGTREALRRGVERMWPLTGAMLIFGVMFFIGILLCFVPGILVLIATFALVPVVVLERRGPIEGIERSWALSRNAWGEVFVVLLVVYLITALPGMAVGVFAMIGMGGVIATGGDTTAVAGIQATVQVLSGLVRALTIPFSMACTVLLYYDRRVRTEALDVQMMAESLGASGTEAPAGGYPAGGYGQGGYVPGGYPGAQGYGSGGTGYPGGSAYPGATPYPGAAGYPGGSSYPGAANYPGTGGYPGANPSGPASPGGPGYPGGGSEYPAGPAAPGTSSHDEGAPPQGGTGSPDPRPGPNWG